MSVTLKTTYLTYDQQSTLRAAVEYANNPRDYASDERESIAERAENVIRALERQEHVEYDGVGPLIFNRPDPKPSKFARAIVFPFAVTTAFFRHIVSFRP